MNPYRASAAAPRRPYAAPRVYRRWAWSDVFKANPTAMLVDSQRHGFRHGSETSWAELANWALDRWDAIRADTPAGDVFEDFGVWINGRPNWLPPLRVAPDGRALAGAPSLRVEERE